MSTGGMEPGWYADPAGKYELRYHDGSGWTDQVSERGVTATDPFFDRAALEATRPVEAVAVTTTTTAAPAPTPSRSKPIVPIAIALVLVAIALAVVALLLAGGDDDGETVAADADAEATTTTTTEASTTTSTTEATTTTTEAVEPEDVVGTAVGTAIPALRDAGFEVVQREVIDESRPDGEVLSAEEQPDGTVVVTVARPPVTRFLEELSPAEGDVDSPPFNVSGTTYTHGVTAFGCGNSQVVEYDLGRDFRRFQATAGILDPEPSVTRMRLEIALDGEIVATHDLAFGETVELDFDVTGTLRLRLVLSLLEGDRFADCERIGFGDGRLLGVPSEVPPRPTG